MVQTTESGCGTCEESSSLQALKHLCRPPPLRRLMTHPVLCLHDTTMIRFDSDSESDVLQVCTSMGSFQHSNLAVPAQRVCAESRKFV
jgi:hypothetical protein